jgi:hypothetical protein
MKTLPALLRGLCGSLLALTLTGPAPAAPASDDPRPRLMITTDIGGDPDDQQSLVRLLHYANEFAWEGLLATSSGTPGERRDASPRPELIREQIEAYRLIRPRLLRHAEGWPEADTLLGLIKVGRRERGADFIGEGHDTEASRWIIARVDAGSPERPLNLSVWGGQTDLAQALGRVNHERGADGLGAFAARLRVHDIADQDGIAGRMRAAYPGLHYVLSVAAPGADKRTASFRGMYLGGDESLTSRAWVEKHILSSSPLGALFPTETWTAPNPHGCLKEGDTPSWFFFLPLGGNDPSDPSRPGWGGRYERADDGWWIDPSTRHDPDAARATVHRHRPAFQADFARRLDWARE